ERVRRRTCLTLSALIAFFVCDPRVVAALQPWAEISERLRRTKESCNSIMLIIPAIDLKNGQCVRLLQGRKSDVTVYNEDPVGVAREFAAAGAEMIHVVDLDGAFSEGESPNRLVVRRIIDAVDVPVEFGGGIRSLEDVQRLCEAGVG